ncbi:hypothetical protein [Leifsonia aquatica]|uniref:hypothetical protein n=1 Tax=Leifsonia aquatica TaxID=144185 RepID=UPI00381C7EBF
MKQKTQHASLGRGLSARRVRLIGGAAVLGLFVGMSVPVAAQAVETMFANNQGTFQNQVLSSGKYTLLGGYVNINLRGEMWYGWQHGRTVDPAGNQGGTESRPNLKVYWYNGGAKSNARGDCWWTANTYDGFTGYNTCAVVR